jgi:hypothetical protein
MQLAWREKEAVQHHFAHSQRYSLLRAMISPSTTIADPVLLTVTNHNDAKDETALTDPTKHNMSITPTDFLTKFTVTVPPAITALTTLDVETRLDAIYQPGLYDVVCGRGKGSYNRPGNVHFRALVASYITMYQAARTKLDKSTVLGCIVERVHSLTDPRTGQRARFGSRSARSSRRGGPIHSRHAAFRCRGDAGCHDQAVARKDQSHCHSSTRTNGIAGTVASNSSSSRILGSKWQHWRCCTPSMLALCTATRHWTCTTARQCLCPFGRVGNTCAHVDLERTCARACHKQRIGCTDPVGLPTCTITICVRLYSKCYFAMSISL